MMIGQLGWEKIDLINLLNIWLLCYAWQGCPKEEKLREQEGGGGVSRRFRELNRKRKLKNLIL